MRQQIGQGESQQDTHERDREGDAQRAKINRDVNALVLGLGGYRAVRQTARIERRKKKQRMRRRGQITYGAPDDRLLPGGIRLFKKRYPRTCVLGIYSTCGAHKNSAQSGLFNIQAIGNGAAFLLLHRIFQIQGQCGKHGLRGNLVPGTIPDIQSPHSARQVVGNDRVVNAVEQYRAQGQQKAQSNEKKQGRDQRVGPQVSAPLCFAQALTQVCRADRCHVLTWRARQRTSCSSRRRFPSRIGRWWAWHDRDALHWATTICRGWTQESKPVPSCG